MIFKEFKVKIKKESKSYSDSIGFINILKADGTWKFKVSYDDWRKGVETLSENTHSNEPTGGFIVSSKIQHFNRYSNSQPKVRVLDPRGFEIEITLDNFFEILNNGIEPGGVIKGEYVYAYFSNSLELISINSERYKDYNPTAKEDVIKAKIEEGYEPFKRNSKTALKSYRLSSEGNKESFLYPYLDTYGSILHLMSYRNRCFYENKSKYKDAYTTLKNSLIKEDSEAKEICLNEINSVIEGMNKIKIISEVTDFDMGVINRRTLMDYNFIIYTTSTGIDYMVNYNVSNADRYYKNYTVLDIIKYTNRTIVRIDYIDKENGIFMMVPTNSVNGILEKVIHSDKVKLCKLSITNLDEKGKKLIRDYIINKIN